VTLPIGPTGQPVSETVEFESGAEGCG
jgi:hypothetical protein